MPFYAGNTEVFVSHMAMEQPRSSHQPNQQVSRRGTNGDSNHASSSNGFGVAGYIGWSLFSGLIPKSVDPSLSPNSSISSASLASSIDNTDYVLDGCKCCGNIIKYPSHIQKYRCVFCDTMFVTNNYDFNTPSHGIKALSQKLEPISFQAVKRIADVCFEEFRKHIAENSPSRVAGFEKFRPLEDYLYRSFNSFDCLSRSFPLFKNYKLSHSQPNVDFKEVRETFKLLLSLPVKKPFFVLLTAVSNLLQSPLLTEAPEDLNWLLILLELPTLPFCLRFGKPPADASQNATTPTSRMHPNIIFFESREVKNVSYKIIERVIGFLSNCDEVCVNYLVNWFAKYSTIEFKSKVELINLYITFQMRSLLNRFQEAEHDKGKNQPAFPESLAQRRYLSENLPNSGHDKFNDSLPTSASTVNSSSSNFLQMPSRLPVWPANSKKRSKKNDKFRLGIAQYGNEWRLKTAAKFLSFFYQALTSGKSDIRCESSFFYNSMVDFINVKQDFDAWQTLSGKKSTTKTELKVNDMVISVNDYLRSAVSVPISPIGASGNVSSPTFAFCQFPFLLSLAGKISIIEYEAKSQMSKKAEEAFLHAVNKKTIVEVHFKVRIRRDQITNDSLRCIKENAKDLKKSLKVEFIGEVGIDAGGLKKEWFLILTKKLLDPLNGLFYNIDQSNYLWFTLNADNAESLELYYLIGVVLGLAMYNSTILDLKFPHVLFKLLFDKPVGFQDYCDLFPETASNLKKMGSYDGDDFNEVFDGFYFDLSYKDAFDKIHTVDLIEKGGEIAVNKSNKNSYIKKYSEYFLIDGIKEKFEAFKRGFHSVINGNSYSLLSPEEVELILCGSDEANSKFDLVSLKSVTKYNGFADISAADKTAIVKWFWEFFEGLSIAGQKKLMLFITGSDRIPATGIVSMNFKITKLGSDTGRLPVAHTCFNELCIYEYSSKDNFFSKLSMAMNESEGFGIK
ncbi:putative E3 ubiquitin-protein ligase [Saccharomycopsis crataegensis]|uniref:HECT-type E3 ubiquitin transferase n=1 Tax=Saccharomycopsis crataegensis TaxID=43959 RepID=A0AAV5QRS9_9ASCO|nr:putative E3 ubiquitin-protein ligase [Saccharomycopsis crataegensis]